MSVVSLTADPVQVAAVRRFNRFFTAHMGLLDQGLLQSRFSVTEARIIFELAQHDVTEVAELRSTLGIDAGHLSRVLGRLTDAGMVQRGPSKTDGRRHVIWLTQAGRDAAATLNARSDQQAADLLGRLTATDQRALVGALETVERLLGETATPRTYLIRDVEPGDLGWVTQRHGALYSQEYGWDQTFEALVAQILADYGREHDAGRERGWIAEADGLPVGCVFCMRDDDHTARLRLLLVDPSTRGSGLGGRLVDECVRFARGAGYRKITLWTNDVLTAARRIYVKAGFTLVEEEPHHSFGHDLVGQNWSLDLI